MTDSGNAIRIWRHKQTPLKTLAALAAEIGTSKANLSRIETGEQELSYRLAKKLAAVTGMSLRELMPAMASEFADAEPAA